jgi:hypothetical protein
MDQRWPQQPRNPYQPFSQPFQTPFLQAPFQAPFSPFAAPPPPPALHQPFHDPLHDPFSRDPFQSLMAFHQQMDNMMQSMMFPMMQPFPMLGMAGDPRYYAQPEAEAQPRFEEITHHNPFEEDLRSPKPRVEEPDDQASSAPSPSPSPSVGSTGSPAPGPIFYHRQTVSSSRPDGSFEVQEMVRDSQGQRVSHKRGLGNKVHSVQRHRGITGEEKTDEYFQGMHPDDLSAFDQQWASRSSGQPAQRYLEGSQRSR